ncbi:MAG: YlxR family protein [Bacilli bacterium]|nr:YlxR family protein [Bacilli bacterium]
MMKVKKIPMRTCVVTREKLPKQELVRVVRMPDGNIVIDLTGKKNGRGAYLKKDINVFEKAKKNKTLDKMLEVEIPDNIFDELKNIL